MLRSLFLLIVGAFTPVLCSAALSFEGTALPPVAVEPASASGLAGIYVVNDFTGCKIVYTTTSAAASSVTCERYGLRGAAYPVPIEEADIVRQGNTVTISNITENSGYAFTEGTRTVYYWVSSYATAPFNVQALAQSHDETYCDRISLSPSGSAPRMIYYGVDGRLFTIDRKIAISYHTLAPGPDKDEPFFEPAEHNTELPYIDGNINLDAPLCDTQFFLTGDRFLESWNRAIEIASPTIPCKRVSILTSAVQHKETGESEVPTDEPLGGSAPVEIQFRAAVTEAASYTRWQIATNPDFTNVVLYTPDLEFTQTFYDAGERYVKFEAADASGTCGVESEVYTVSIGESSLLCPNAFSPGATEGVNDVWKVSYKSIVKFDCYIFNRWGEKIAEFHDPAQGWDGKYRGKLVPAGVYYYVIKATGADGKSYELSGDINILRYSGH